MGGDDLCSDDDEYLSQSWAKDIPFNDGEDDNMCLQSKNQQMLQSRKRKLTDGEKSSANEVVPELRHEHVTMGSHIIKAGNGIEKSSAEDQSAFMWTCFLYWLGMDNNEMDDSSNLRKFSPRNFYTPEPSKQKVSHDQKHSHVMKYNTMGSIVSFLRGGALPSMKRLKNWNISKSPMVLIICSSTNRAVSLLKDLSPMKARVAKLFSKHMNVLQQVEMMETNSYGIAVGTPNRLLKLFEMRCEDEIGQSARHESNAGKDANSTKVGSQGLDLDYTELVVVDCHVDRKKYTVCTLNDTAPDLMRFIQMAIVPQIKKRKTRIKFALF